MRIENFIKEEKFHHFFQPIFNTENWKCEGYEVLLRSEVFPNPAHTFEAAKKAKKLYELDSRSIHKAISTYSKSVVSNKEGQLFINVFPSTIQHIDFLTFLNDLVATYKLHRTQIVLEVSESELIQNLRSFNVKVAELKRQGFKIAIDDIGTGYANFQSIIELEPDFIKLDRYFSKKLHMSKKKQTIISLFIQYCREHEVRLVLEGLESELEVAMAKSLGVPIAQGFALGKPALLRESV